jgi:hypothetical protein
MKNTNADPATQAVKQTAFNERKGPIIKIDRYGKRSFVQILQATVRDNELSLAARGLLAYILTLPEGWQPHPKQLRRELNLTKHSWDALLGELRAVGYARILPMPTGGRKIEVAEWPKWAATPAKVRNTDGRKNALYKNEPFRKNELLVQEYTVQEERERAVFHESSKTAHPLFLRPRFPYPKTEEEMYATLEARGIEPDPDYDGDFFNDMEQRDWRLPNGAPVYDWIALYEARLQTTSPENAL